MTARRTAAEGWEQTRLGWLRADPSEEETGYPPRGVEVRALERHVSLRGRDVLEIGCGDGRLTLQYAARARSVDALDANRREIAIASARARRLGLAHVRFRALPTQRWRPDPKAYDIALFTHSL